MLAALGDLIDDVVVRLGGPINEATDTVARIERRRGGSAANVAAAAIATGHPARFLGQVGADAIGEMLLGELDSVGVDVSCVRRAGRTGTIVVVVDQAGERTMLSDRGASVDLCQPERQWLDGVNALHVPLYSLDGEPLASTAATVIGWAREADVRVSIDVSSVELIERLGVEHVYGLLGELRPDVVFANADEAGALAIDGPIGRAVTVVKRGAEPVEVFVGPNRLVCEVPPIGRIVDTTGAGDAFAAGFMSSAGGDVGAACAAGCAAAATLLASRSR